MKVLIFSLLFFVSFICKAEESKKIDELGPWGVAALLEGIVLANAAIASEAPKELGWGLTVLSPFALANEGSIYTKTIGALSLAALGQYNVQELSDEKQYSKSDIFKNNIYAFHAFAAIAFLTEWLTGNEKAGEHIALFPSNDGFVLALNYEL